MSKALRAGQYVLNVVVERIVLPKKVRSLFMMTFPKKDEFAQFVRRDQYGMN